MIPRGTAAAALALAAVSLIGPPLVGTPDPPSLAPSAAQLLPPGTRIDEVVLPEGDRVRAPRIELADDSLTVHFPSGSHRRYDVTSEGGVRRRTVWLGTDHQGRDLLARAVHGTRTSLSVGALAVLVALGLGTGLGLATALLPAPLRAALHVAVDALLGLPRVLLLLMLGAIFRGTPAGVGLAIGLASWMTVARLVEAESRRLLVHPFVDAARASGAGAVFVATRHLLPNLAGVVGATLPLVATRAVVLEATLSFLGVGSGSGAVSWGRIIADGYPLLPHGWWVAVFPGLLLVATALALSVPAEADAGVAK